MQYLRPNIGIFPMFYLFKGISHFRTNPSYQVILISWVSYACLYPREIPIFVGYYSSHFVPVVFAIPPIMGYIYLPQWDIVK